MRAVACNTVSPASRDRHRGPDPSITLAPAAVRTGIDATGRW
ncbi:hypothetical protein NJ7G_1819 [Natrinema sp. J7-2]|nr:hypothetical protein NJ7G_1819 [Natrinema sp. J7-2]